MPSSYTIYYNTLLRFCQYDKRRLYYFYGVLPFLPRRNVLTACKIYATMTAMDRYYSFNNFAREKFGCKTYKLALSGGMTCPNRDGTLGTRGCIFCSEGGSGDFAEPPCDDVLEQIEKAKSRVKQKIGDNAKFIAYFQSYTNTYAPLEKLKTLFSAAIEPDCVAALSVATRPDCLPEEVVEYLSKLNKIKPVFVELGLQTIHEKTADYIRRGYALPVFDDALKRLKTAGINVVAHVILGLPGESRGDMLDTVRYVGKSGADGIKLQLLHVLRGTDLCADYEKGLFKTLEKDEYIDIIGEAINILPKSTVIHRLTGDAPKKLLVAPLWSADKKAVLAAMYRSFEQKNVIQGSKCDY